jgi:hypothetical protein
MSTHAFSVVEVTVAAVHITAPLAPIMASNVNPHHTLHPPPRRAGYRCQHPWGPHTPFEGLVVIAHALTLKEGQRRMPFDIPPPRVLSDPSFDLKPTIMAAAHTIGLATSMV